jgi:hypothetical protein
MLCVSCVVCCLREEAKREFLGRHSFDDLLHLSHPLLSMVRFDRLDGSVPSIHFPSHTCLFDVTFSLTPAISDPPTTPHPSHPFH